MHSHQSWIFSPSLKASTLRRRAAAGAGGARQRVAAGLGARPAKALLDERSELQDRRQALTGLAAVAAADSLKVASMGAEVPLLSEGCSVSRVC